MPETITTAQPVAIGIDTHKDTHHVAVITTMGEPVEDFTIPATAAGYTKAIAAIGIYDSVEAVGIECTGTYGANITKAFLEAGYLVYEVNRPNRFARRRQGKTDQFDAYHAAEAVLSHRTTAIAKARNGFVEALRPLHAFRRLAVKNRSAELNHLQALLVSAPENIKAAYQPLSAAQRLKALVDADPSSFTDTIEQEAMYVLKLAAERIQRAHAEIKDLEKRITNLLRQYTPQLLDIYGAGPDTIAQLLLTVGDNPERFYSEAGFAALTGVCPIPASSGRTNRHRLNRGGDRQANRALHTTTLVRMRHDQRTKDYVARRTAEGKTTKEIQRCLKRAIAREMFREIRDALNQLNNHPQLAESL
ncbi:IS110 family transposase [Corynebacterium yudongzhengii]|uniref:IS110 family transposase n=1 Tax=Corynebacterium yudongzhengii TaxID=2080740 RepID=UPI0018EEC266|nr:IS110 family transposase [Corynebacterium yudongzhengii]